MDGLMVLFVLIAVALVALRGEVGGVGRTPAGSSLVSRSSITRVATIATSTPSFDHLVTDDGQRLTLVSELKSIESHLIPEWVDYLVAGIRGRGPSLEIVIVLDEASLPDRVHWWVVVTRTMESFPHALFHVTGLEWKGASDRLVTHRSFRECARQIRLSHPQSSLTPFLRQFRPGDGETKAVAAYRPYQWDRLTQMSADFESHDGNELHGGSH